MKRIIKISSLLIVFTSSCSYVKATKGDWWQSKQNLTDNAYYNIDDASIRLIMRHNSDTLCKTNYDQINNLPGKYFKFLSTTNKIDTVNKLGVQIKLWAKIIMNEKGAYYGEYPKNGLLKKIDKIVILFRNDNMSIDITNFLIGDSTISEVKWRKCEYKKLPYTWGSCPYIKNVKSMVNMLNDGDKLNRIPNHDYIFWLDKEAIKSISFKPTYLQMRITLIDTTGTKNRELTDSIKIE